MRVVIDANIFVSFLLTKGATISAIINFWETGRFTLLISEEILEEIDETVKRFVNKDIIDENEAKELSWRLRVDTEIINIHSIVLASKDKKDNRYLVCSDDGQADYLVSGDKKHLLPLKKFGLTKIISPRDFVEILV